MGDTKIEWTDKTWNPVRGCSRVSQGCVNCYAERQAARFAAEGEPFHLFATKVNGHPAWTGKVELVEKHLEDPLHWRKPCRVFVNSMSDLFHEALPDGVIDRVFAVMALCPQHTFQILTKRPERMLSYFSDTNLRQELIGIRAELISGLDRHYDGPGTTPGYGVTWRIPLANVWLGVSVEDQANKYRIDILRQVPAAIRFLSIEPLLEDIGTLNLDGIHWVIVGGESGPGARPFDIAWARNIIAQCKAAGVACFYKQGGASNACQHDRKGGHFECFAPDLQVREFPTVAEVSV